MSVKIEDFIEFSNHVIRDEPVVVLTNNSKSNRILDIFEDFVKKNDDLVISHKDFVTEDFILARVQKLKNDKPYGRVNLQYKHAASVKGIIEKFLKESFYTEESFNEKIQEIVESIETNLKSLKNKEL